MTIGAPRPPLEFEKVTSYAAVLQNTRKFSLAPSALTLDTLYFSLKRREKTQYVRWHGRFLYGAKRVDFLKCR